MLYNLYCMIRRRLNSPLLKIILGIPFAPADTLEFHPLDSPPKSSKHLNGKEALLSAQKLGELLFVQLRPATEQLGGKISWTKGDGTSVRVPVARAQ